MRKSSYVIAALALVLVASNAYWLYSLLDSGVSYSYLHDSYRTARTTAVQALAVLPIAARVNSSPAEVVAAAARADGNAKPFEKEGYTWVGDLGLKFGLDGRLVDAKPSVEPF